MKKRQRTIAKKIELSGIGLHTGKDVRIELCPAPANHGINFIRTDLPGKPKIPVDVSLHSHRRRCTTLTTGNAEVQTVEHLLAALFGRGIDNLDILLSASEMPGTDGSAQPFVDLIDKVGVAKLDAPASRFVVKSPIAVEENGATITAFPFDEGLKITYTLDYSEYGLPIEQKTITITPETFRELANSRTFCFKQEVDQLVKVEGLGKGAGYHNTLVYDNGRIIENELRHKDEFLRHKVLDLLGDLSLLGADLFGHLVANKSGHNLNVKLVKKLKEAMTLGTSKTLLDIRQIQEILPHRYPFLLVDRIIEMEDGKRVVGLKNVTVNEEFFQGHFPGQPVMPGVLQIEAMAQTGGILMLRHLQSEGKVAYLLAVDGVKFRRPVVPGDQLRIEVTAQKIKASIGKISGKITVDGEVTTEADIKFALADPKA